MTHELLTLDGGKILARLVRDDRPVIRCDDDVTLATNEYEESALLYQLREQVSLTCPRLQGSLTHAMLYIDFTAAFPLKERTWFDRLFEEGFAAVFPHTDTPPCRFVPFLSSQSQSKERIFAFIREELFAPMRQRLDLDIPFEHDIQKKSLAYVTKLYAYRALYASAATGVLHGRDDGADAFFNEDNIIILPDIKHTPQAAVRVFTAEQEPTPDADKNEVVIRPKVCERCVPIECFDSVGLISPQDRDIINKRLPRQMRGNSFQVRMPFFKGVLHTVDFHRFLRDSGVTGEHAYVTDVFGRRRDLFRANIIVTPSVFKLKSLLPKDSTDVMHRYFDKLRAYDHGLYVVQTEAAIHSTQYVRLNAQLLSTLDLSSEELDALVEDHIRQADAFCAESLTDPAARQRLFAIADRSDWMDLLLKEPRFIHDKHIQRLIEDYRISRYKDIARGRLRVQGESRFLSGDLFYFLICLLRNVAADQPQLADTCAQLSRRRIKYGAVYIPQAAVDTDRVALLRNPHLSRNEDVGTVVAKGGLYHYYDKYLGHLRGVVFVGDRSYIPAALGGADFDGDHISIIYDERIVNACYKSGYVERRGQTGTVPFISIPALQGVGAVTPYRYVSAQAVYNTFSNRIGEISNAAMKIAAVEYDRHLPRPDYSAALCTILTGNEIDATKKGVRPYIHDVKRYTGEDNTAAAEVVREIARYIRVKEVLDSHAWRGRVPKVQRQGDTLLVKEKDLPIDTLTANREHPAVTQLLYRWAEACLRLTENRPQTDPAEATAALDSVFDTADTAREQTGRILRDHERTRRKYAALRERRQRQDSAIRANTAKACVRLKAQYDNIYLPTDGALACWDKYNQLQEELLLLTESFSAEEFRALSARLFSEASDSFDPHAFWPYAHTQTAAAEMPLYERVMRLPYAELLHNFDGEGYRLLYYALNNAILYASRPQAEEPATDDSRYHACYCENAAKGVPITVFERRLAALAREDLLTVYQATDPAADTAAVIRRLYPPATAEQQAAFWRLFTVREVMDALGGDGNAE